MKRYRDRMRAQGLRPVQLWVPDTRSEQFVDEFTRQAMAVAQSEQVPSAETRELDSLMESQDLAGWSA